MFSALLSKNVQVNNHIQVRLIYIFKTKTRRYPTRKDIIHNKGDGSQPNKNPNNTVYYTT